MSRAPSFARQDVTFVIRLIGRLTPLFSLTISGGRQRASRICRREPPTISLPLPGWVTRPGEHPVTIVKSSALMCSARWSSLHAQKMGQTSRAWKRTVMPRTAMKAVAAKRRLSSRGLIWNTCPTPSRASLILPQLPTPCHLRYRRRSGPRTTSLLTGSIRLGWSFRRVDNTAIMRPILMIYTP